MSAAAGAHLLKSAPAETRHALRGPHATAPLPPTRTRRVTATPHETRASSRRHLVRRGRCCTEKWVSRAIATRNLEPAALCDEPPRDLRFSHLPQTNEK